MSFWPPDPTADPAFSRYTGKPLRRIRYELGVNGDQRHTELDAALDAAANGTALVADSDGGRWEVKEHSLSWQDGQSGTSYRHSVVFQEHEELGEAR